MNVYTLEMKSGYGMAIDGLLDTPQSRFGIIHLSYAVPIKGEAGIGLRGESLSPRHQNIPEAADCSFTLRSCHVSPLSSKVGRSSSIKITADAN